MSLLMSHYILLFFITGVLSCKQEHLLSDLELLLPILLLLIPMQVTSQTEIPLWFLGVEFNHLLQYVLPQECLGRPREIYHCPCQVSEIF